ncbi:hypothetical protein BGX28_007259 [Mortierella sp. GBA30]|nr:hypothetical protein BGX28_007259 [Mortierella sp. GBA30]
MKLLMHVELCSGLLHMAEEKISERFAEAVSGLRHLRHFTMRDVDLTASATLAIMRATFPLPHLRELHLAFPILPAESEDPVQLKDVGPMTESILEQAVAIKTAEGTITTKITALSIPSTQDEFGVSFLLPFLKSKLFDLDTLQIPATDLHLRGRALEDALRKYCPKVKHLRCQPFCIEDYKDITNACAVIRGCTGLQSYHAESIDDEVNTRPIIDTLLEHHAKTLEAYEDLRGYSPLKSKHLKSMLCSCKNLRRVWVEPGIWSYALEFGQILSKEWVCLRMKELSLCLDRYDAKEAEMLKFTNTMRQQRYRDGRLPSVDGNPVSDDAHYWGRCYYSSEVDKWAAKRVYAQIGKLVVLEVLALKVHEFSTPGFITERFTWDLTLKDGYLRELGGLRKLRHFHMASNFWLNMGQAEVEFMHEQWPALCEISFDLCHIRADTVKKEDEFQNLVGQPHWRWFLEKRPTLHYANRTLWGEM